MMPERSGNDPAIRLFGQEIPLPLESASLAVSGKSSGDDKDSPTTHVTEATQDDDSLPPSSSGEEEPAGHETTPDCNGKPKTPSIDEEDSSKSRSSEAENEQSDVANSPEKPLKKPDKILPCPRCNSMDTKFCYYNNYNVNQPRHFCKACQRYWTAGGTMRNVPVGAGRRKNKNSASNYHHITISEALRAASIDAASGTCHPPLKTKGSVLSFGLEPPNCNSMTSILNLADKKTSNRSRNGFHGLVEKRTPCKFVENTEDCSSSVTGPSTLEQGGPNHPQQGINPFAPPITCLPGVAWPHPWNSAVAPPTPFCPAGYPMPFFPPAAYWNCGIPGAWNIPMLLSPQSSSSSNQNEHRQAPNSSKLGKRSRDTDEHKNGNGCVLVPKTLRIDDPDEAAKSSIWATLGITNESCSRESFFKAIQPKSDHERNHLRPAEAPRALCANPAALSRSIGFRESS